MDDLAVLRPVPSMVALTAALTADATAPRWAVGVGFVVRVSLRAMSPVLPMAIRCLLSARRPAAIAGLVVAVVIDAVERHVCGTLAHVSEEVLKEKPSLADTDAPASIARPLGHGFIAAASAHSAPTLVSGGASGAVLLPSQLKRPAFLPALVVGDAPAASLGNAVAVINRAFSHVRIVPLLARRTCEWYV